MEVTLLGMRLFWTAGSRCPTCCICKIPHFAVQSLQRNVNTHARYCSASTTNLIETLHLRFLTTKANFPLLFHPSVPYIYRQNGAPSCSYNHVGTP
jgi:hypothetical protein